MVNDPVFSYYRVHYSANRLWWSSYLLGQRSSMFWPHKQDERRGASSWAESYLIYQDWAPGHRSTPSQSLVLGSVSLCHLRPVPHMGIWVGAPHCPYPLLHDRTMLQGPCATSTSSHEWESGSRVLMPNVPSLACRNQSLEALCYPQTPGLGPVPPCTPDLVHGAMACGTTGRPAGWMAKHQGLDLARGLGVKHPSSKQQPYKKKGVKLHWLVLILYTSPSSCTLG